jgi:uncharacterized protein YjlB
MRDSIDFSHQIDMINVTRWQRISLSFKRWYMDPNMVVQTLIDDGVFPNNAQLPLILYRRGVTLPARHPATGFEDLFAANHWPPAWRYGVYGYHHYHSTAHEVLGIFRGHATVQFGGEQGVVLSVEKGDVVIIPAGVAHKNLDCSRDFRAVGAYPDGQRPDTRYGKPGERPQADANIAKVPLPKADPVFGEQGKLMTQWMAALTA